MNHEYICFCGLYCENCATKAKVEPAARVLYREMKQAGFAEIMQFFSDGNAFWSFLQGIAEEGTCQSCYAGSGNPGCQIRICAKEKGMTMCAFCESYPREKFSGFLEIYPMLKEDNDLLQNEGMEAWAKLQEQRKAAGYTYSEHK